MTPDEIKDALFDFITDEVDLDKATDIEFQNGGCWVDLKDGTTLSITIQKIEE